MEFVNGTEIVKRYVCQHQGSDKAYLVKSSGNNHYNWICMNCFRLSTYYAQIITYRGYMIRKQDITYV